jgi:hypothetical protein
MIYQKLGCCVGRHPASESMTLYDRYIKAKNNERKKEKVKREKLKKGKRKQNKMKEKKKGRKLRRQLSRTYDLLRTMH